MASTSRALAVAQSADRAGTHDRLFYSTMAAAMALAVFAGFARTYYLPLFSGGPTATIAGLPFAPVVHIHGALFTAWVVLFMVQTTLVAQRRIAVHRKLGIAGAMLAAAMVVSGTAIRFREARLLGGRSLAASLSSFVLGISDILMFATFVAAALALRRNKEAHKRLMLLAYVSILNAAIARIPGMPSQHAAIALTLLPIAVGMTYDGSGTLSDHAAGRTSAE
jgi:hypothetical protein